MITDEMLSQAAAELADAINASLPAPEECHHQFSAKFERKMKRLIYRTNHPVQHRILRSVASILLVILLGFSSVLAVSVEARMVVFGWVREQYESFYEYFFEGQPGDVEPASYYPGWIPDGFKYETTFEIAGGESLIYIDSDGMTAEFTYSTTPESFSMFIESVDCEQLPVWINGFEGTLYLPADSTQAGGVIWTNDSGDTIFHVSAAVEPEVLIKIAEQITKINK